MQYDTNYLGFKLKSLRLTSGYSLAYVCGELDITQSYLSLVENGTRVPSHKIVTKAARLYRVTPTQLLSPPVSAQSVKALINEHGLEDLLSVFFSLLKELPTNETK